MGLGCRKVAQRRVDNRQIVTRRRVARLPPQCLLRIGAGSGEVVVVERKQAEGVVGGGKARGGVERSLEPAAHSGRIAVADCQAGTPQGRAQARARGLVDIDGCGGATSCWPCWQVVVVGAASRRSIRSSTSTWGGGLVGGKLPVGERKLAVVALSPLQRDTAEGQRGEHAERADGGDHRRGTRRSRERGQPQLGHGSPSLPNRTCSAWGHILRNVVLTTPTRRSAPRT